MMMAEGLVILTAHSRAYTRMTLDGNIRHTWELCRGFSWILASDQLQVSCFLSMILPDGL